MPHGEAGVKFTEALIHSGWREVRAGIEYRKSSWIVFFDTSSWVEVGTEKNQRVFDVPVPEDQLSMWTVKLVEHLCKAEDELVSLRASTGDL